MFRLLYVENVYVWVLVIACRAPGNLCWIVLFWGVIQGILLIKTQSSTRELFVFGFQGLRNLGFRGQGYVAQVK